MATTERRGKIEWWMWLMAALVIGGLIYMIVAMADNKETVVSEDVIRTDAARPAEEEPVGFVPVRAIIDKPEDFWENDLAGAAVVEQVVSEMSFFVRGEGGDRILAVLAEPALRNPPTLQRGYKLHLEALPSNALTVPADRLQRMDAATQEALRGEKVFLHVRSVRVLGTAPLREPMPVDLVLLRPADYYGRVVSGTARVTRAETDRGFYVLGSEPKRIFVILAEALDTPDWRTVIEGGQLIYLEGTVHRADERRTIREMQPLESEDLARIEQHGVFVRATRVEILQP